MGSYRHGQDPSLEDMRRALTAAAAVPVTGAGLRVFGLMWCDGCGATREFVSSDAHVQHITDAACDTCGYVYGRIDIPERRRGEVVGGTVREVVTPAQRAVPVISDDVAAAARQRWFDCNGGRHVQLEPPPLPPQVPEVADESRVASFRRSLAQ